MSEDSDIVAKLKETIKRADIAKAATDRWDMWFDVERLDRDLRRRLSFHDLRRLGEHAVRAFVPDIDLKMAADHASFMEELIGTFSAVLDVLDDHAAGDLQAIRARDQILSLLPRAEAVYAQGCAPIRKNEALCAALDGLRSIRVFVQDCIETGHDRAMLGNLYSARDTVDAAIAQAEENA